MKSSTTIALVPSIKTGPWIYWHDLTAGLEKSAALGFDAVELFTASGDAVDAAQLEAGLKRYNLHLSAVGTGAGKVVRGLTLTDPDPDVRADALAFIADMIRFGAQFGAPAIIGSMQGNVAPGVTREQALAWLADALDRLGQLAGDLGVPLVYEPLNRYETNLINDLATGAGFVRSLNTAHVKLLADLFHMNIEEVSIAQSILDHHALIGHVHLADSNRRPGGMGHTPMAEIASSLKQVGYEGFVSAEALPYPNPDEAAKQTIQTFNHYFK